MSCILLIVLMLFILEYSQGLRCTLWDDSARSNEMGSLCYKISSTGNGPASVKSWFLQILDTANLPEVLFPFLKKEPQGILSLCERTTNYIPFFHVVQNISSHKGFFVGSDCFKKRSQPSSIYLDNFIRFEYRRSLCVFRRTFRKSYCQGSNAWKG